ncbi:uncharacterized protein LOC123292968 [Chrysoperla carnea]|uniref:uncharacterized protein LOC123292968 n=1 Tax=Chrysoperla carnea TaxID=189513 RepID=UPI001D091D29|nr:uncharacterized protein LOC123292968 [Chrysoperla carnea]
MADYVWNYLIILNTIVIVSTIPPPGYVKEGIEDQHPPNYKYSYDIEHNKDGTSQGKQETRDGEFASGRYYVSLPRRGASSQVQYFADDWGYHPFVQYSTTNAHSKVSAHFALGEQAIKALHNSNKQQINTGAAIFSTAIQPTQHKQIEQQTEQNLAIPPPAISTQQLPPQQYLIRPQSDQSILLPVIFQTYPTTIQQPPSIAPIYQQNIPFELIEQHENLRSLENNNLQQNGRQQVEQQQNQVQILINHNTQEQINNNQIQNEKQEDSGTINSSDNSGYSKLVKNTENLITGADVLNINSAAELNTEITETQSFQDQQSSNNFIYQQNELYQNSTIKPIIVAEFSSTGGENIISSTEKPHEDCDQENEEESKTLNEETRPLSINFLAPITAALRLESSGEKIENIITCDNDEAHENEKKTEEDTQITNNNVEIQKSIPFYIGKFEFFDDLKGNLKPLSSEENGEESMNVPSKIEYHFESLKENKKDDEKSSDQDSAQSIRNVQHLPNTLVIPNAKEQKFVDEIIVNQTQPIQIPTVQIPIQIPVEIRPIAVATQLVEKTPVPSATITVPQPVEFGKYLEKSIAQPYIIPIPHSNPIPITKLLSVPMPIKQFRPIPIYYVNQYPKDIHGGRQNIGTIGAATSSYKVPISKPNGQRLKDACTEINKKFCDDYYGPTPPFNHNVKPRRNAYLDRKFFGKNLRIEYGFKPPMVPSLEIDEYGNPIHKDESR